METGWNVGKLLNISSGYWKGCTLQAAVRLDIFSHLGNDCIAVGEVAEKADTDQVATEMLLDGLAAMALLEKTDTRYGNTDFSRNYLVRSSPQYMGHIILHHHHILDGWAQLDTAVATGRPADKRSYGAEIERQSFLLGMYNLAMGLAPELAKRIDLNGCSRLLDLGGGPGTYAIHFCLANPHLQAVIFDRATTEPFARQTIDAYKINDRVSFIGGDFTTEAIEGGPYDAAWLSHILHSNDEETCRRIIEKTARQMLPGGRILIHDFILDNTRTAPEFAALFSLNMLINNGVGRSYTDKEIRTMMELSGLSDLQRLSVGSANDSSILMGIV
mgnify:CR=1 FL=1